MLFLKVVGWSPKSELRPPPGGAKPGGSLFDSLALTWREACSSQNRNSSVTQATFSSRSGDCIGATVEKRTTNENQTTDQASCLCPAVSRSRDILASRDGNARSDLHRH